TAGEAAVSGISLVDTINTLIIQIYAALSTGGAVVVSQYLGRRDSDNVKAASSQLLYIMIFVSILLTAVALIFRQHILSLIFGRLEPAVMDNALIYFLLTASAFPFIGIYNAGAALFRAMGNSKVSMYCTLTINLINISINALLIYGFNMGAAGAGIGTLVSRIAAAVIIMTLLNRYDYG
uniref:MATE family efflux transporter n=2 Tax=Paenibacillus TaxID=44249 RepID=UPI00164294F8